MQNSGKSSRIRDKTGFVGNKPYLIGQGLASVSRCHCWCFSGWLGRGFGVPVSESIKQLKQLKWEVLTPPFRNSHDLIEQCPEIAKIPENTPYSSLTWGISTAQYWQKHSIPSTKVQHPNSSWEMTKSVNICRKTCENHCFVHPTLPVYVPTDWLTMSIYCQTPENHWKPWKPRIRTFQ